MTEQAASERMTIKEIAALTQRDAKSLRAYLRKHFARDESMKNSRWGDSKEHRLNKTQTKALVEHFTRKSEQEPKAS